MPTYVARIEGPDGTIMERADVTVELLPDGDWRARFIAPSNVKLTRGAQVELAFADGRHGRAQVNHIHKPSSKKALRLVETSGVGALS